MGLGTFLICVFVIWTTIDNTVKLVVLREKINGLLADRAKINGKDDLEQVEDLKEVILEHNKKKMFHEIDGFFNQEFADPCIDIRPKNRYPDDSITECICPFDAKINKLLEINTKHRDRILTLIEKAQYKFDKTSKPYTIEKPTITYA